MYSDLFDQLGRGVGGRRSSAVPAEPPEEPPLVALKAGKIQLVSNSSNSNSNNSYQCTADPARGEIRLVWDAATNELQWQWYDRRNKVVQDRIPITNVNSGTFARVPLADKAHALDRVYVWSSNSSSSTSTATNPPEQEHRMYWMQDAEVGDEEELLVQKINEYLQDPTKATPEGTNSLLPTSTAARAAAATANSSSHQVDALSSILENLGMPQSSAVESAAPTNSAAGATSSSSSTTPGSTTSTGALTLADLQGAMAGIAAATAATTIVPLQDLWTPQALDQLLSDPAVVERLLPLLPESQQSVEHLRDNLQSPQVRHTLQALQQALLPDDEHNYSGYASVLANFQLDPAEGQALLAQGNPLAAFLECVVASVEKEKKQEQENSGTNDDDANMEEKDGDGEDEETKDREAEA